MKSSASNCFNLPKVGSSDALQVGTCSIASVLSAHLVQVVLLLSMKAEACTEH